VPWKPPRKVECNVCGDEFWPKTSRHFTCSKIECGRVRDKRWQIAHSHRALGRVCSYCGVTDSDARFGTKDACKTCYRAQQKYGPCNHCGGRLRKVPGKPEIFCSRCADEGRDSVRPFEGPDGRVWNRRKIGENDETVQVRTYCGRDFSRFFVHTDETVKLPSGEVWVVQDIVDKVGGVHLVQDRRTFVGLGVNDALAIRGISEPSFPRDLAFLSNKTFNLFYEVAHYTLLGECSPVGFAWWANKFKGGIELASADRAWQRFKRQLREVGVKITVQPGKAFSFDDEAGFVDIVMKAANVQTKKGTKWT
jgi:hypothetical protein